jgi:hypothetical protein
MTVAVHARVGGVPGREVQTSAYCVGELSRALPLSCQLPQPLLEVVEAALDVAELGEEVQRFLPADGVTGAGLSMAIERRSCSTSRRRSMALV